MERRLVWEKMNDDSDLERIAVPGGWLVRTSDIINGGVALCFYADREHLWECDG